MINCSIYHHLEVTLKPSLSERVIVDGHGCHTALHFGVKQKKIKTKFLRCTGYLNSIKKTYKARFIANSCSCTTTELSKLLTSCLTAVKKHVIKYCEKVYERSGKNLFWSIKNSGEIYINLKLEISMRPVCLLMIFLLFTLLYLII